MYFCFSSGKCLLIKHKIPLKRQTKLPKKNPKFMESLLTKILAIWLGFENIFLRPNTNDIPDLITYPATVILTEDMRIDSIQP
jgi:hypothetical protein